MIHRTEHLVGLSSLKSTDEFQQWVNEVGVDVRGTLGEDFTSDQEIDLSETELREAAVRLLEITTRPQIVSSKKSPDYHSLKRDAAYAVVPFLIKTEQALKEKLSPWPAEQVVSNLSIDDASMSNPEQSLDQLVNTFVLIPPIALNQYCRLAEYITQSKLPQSQN